MGRGDVLIETRFAAQEARYCRGRVASNEADAVTRRLTFNISTPSSDSECAGDTLLRVRATEKAATFKQ